ncbi:hypothetical protein PUN28_017642 [Cardiocondyla obscurior]|uniref:Uncharacterized protein n=1 Tax=Cardiocondyla obscurior TaxID=286306 RepID=A0AAW2EIF4_9HYME
MSTGCRECSSLMVRLSETEKLQLIICSAQCIIQRKRNLFVDQIINKKRRKRLRNYFQILAAVTRDLDLHLVIDTLLLLCHLINTNDYRAIFRWVIDVENDSSANRRSLFRSFFPPEMSPKGGIYDRGNG